MSDHYTQDWEKKYIHENYSRVLEDDYEVEQVI